MIELKTLLFPSFVTVLTLILFFILTANVGRARLKYKTISESEPEWKPSGYIRVQNL